MESDVAGYTIARFTFAQSMMYTSVTADKGVFATIVFDNLELPGELLRVVQTYMLGNSIDLLPPPGAPMTVSIGDSACFALLGVLPRYEVAWRLVTEKNDGQLRTVDSITISAATSGDPGAMALVFTVNTMRTRDNPPVHDQVDRLNGIPQVAAGLEIVPRIEGSNPKQWEQRAPGARRDVLPMIRTMVVEERHEVSM
jgi:hypothetical protein